MPDNRGAAPVDLPDQNARDSYLVTVQPTGYIQIGYADVPSLGFTYEAAKNASDAFAEKLYHLSEVLDDRRPTNPQAADYAEQLEKSLNLKQPSGKLLPQSRNALDELIALSAPLRQQMSDELANAFKDVGFLRDKPADVQEEPAFTFMTRERAPILWDMLYEGSQVDDFDLDRLWGFRVPIAHWVGLNRPRVIQLRDDRGVFTAINDDLEFANAELEALPKPKTRVSLADAFAHLVDGELPDHLPSDHPHAHTWRQDNAHDWLQRFLDFLSNDPDERQIEAGKWKKKALKRIFQDQAFQYDLLHFGCHGETDPGSGFLASLYMTVGGEPVKLEAGFLLSDLNLNRKWGSGDPGPLIFLNACSTAKTKLPGYERPAFPSNWIKCRGALAVVATLCPVPDYFAHAFARKFYSILKDRSSPRNQYLGEALLQTRRYFMQQYGNPLGLAYVLYTVDRARIMLDFDWTGSVT